MKFSYDPRYNIAYLRLQEKTQGVESIYVSDELIVDMLRDGTIYGIELLNANEQLQRDNEDNLIIVNEATGHQVKHPLELYSEDKGWVRNLYFVRFRAALLLKQIMSPNSP